LQPNYLRIWAGLFALVIYARPAAMIGVAAALGVAYLNLGLSSGSYQLDPEVLLYYAAGICAAGHTGDLFAATAICLFAGSRTWFQHAAMAWSTWC
jgi:hypothetical protein